MGTRTLERDNMMKSRGLKRASSRKNPRPPPEGDHRHCIKNDKGEEKTRAEKTNFPYRSSIRQSEPRQNVERDVSLQKLKERKEESNEQQFFFEEEDRAGV